jgi:hypothetical protein
MNRVPKIAVIMVVLACWLMIASTASALTTTNFQTWLSNPVTEGGKLFTLLEYNDSTLDSMEVNFDTLGTCPCGVGPHTVNVNPTPDFVGPGSFDWKYTVEILSGPCTFAQARLDVDLGGGGSLASTATKTVTGLVGWAGSLTLTSTGGVPDFGAIGGTKIEVAEAINILGSESWVSTTDTYCQKIDIPVPEIDPTSAGGALSLLGMGLAMLMGRRRRRKVA